MTREEILKKSRNENKKMDEREQGITNRAKAISGAIGLTLCMILNFINAYSNGPPAVESAMWTVACGIYAPGYFISAAELKRKSDWVLGVAFTCIGVLHLIQYFKAIWGVL